MTVVPVEGGLYQHTCQRPDCPNSLTVKIPVVAMRCRGTVKGKHDRKESAIEKVPASELGEGAGTQLHGLLKKFGFKITRGCRCLKRIKLMNLWGPDRCEARMTKIVGWLRREAKKRHLPMWGPAGNSVVKVAIHRERKRLAGLAENQAGHVAEPVLK